MRIGYESFGKYWLFIANDVVLQKEPTINCKLNYSLILDNVHKFDITVKFRVDTFFEKCGQADQNIKRCLRQALENGWLSLNDIEDSISYSNGEPDFNICISLIEKY